VVASGAASWDVVEVGVGFDVVEMEIVALAGAEWLQAE
jgi:hypothetical protein